MRLIRLTPEYQFGDFDCGDSDLNDFLVEDAKPFLDKRIANTYILEDEDRIVAYFCLLNDKISRLEVTNSRWKSIKDSFPEGKRFRSYPSIKIGRFAVSRHYRGQRIGSELISTIKYLLGNGQNLSAFRFITVDAYLSAIHFYEKNGFKILSQKEEDKHTRLMYYDMMEV
ncbi:MAG: GNAT family N-acetyltransferase [Bacteroidales bacterium]|nr:GNAT family N-acetyltransferase [Bacteroidales bacterium]